MSKTILVVEDDASVAQLLEDVLTREGFTVRVERDGEWALRAFEAAPPDLVLSDVLLPKLQGFDLLPRLRALPGGAELPIILLSGVFRSATYKTQLVREHGITAYFDKPLDVNELTATVREALGLSAHAAISPAVAATAEARVEVPKRGDLVDIPFARLLGLCLQGRVNGALMLRRASVKKIVYFKEGYPVFVRSNLLTECLGRVMVSERLISQAECDRALELKRKDPARRQGEILVSMGSISPHNLDYALELQMQEKLFEIFSWQEGPFQLNLGTEHSVPEVALSMSPTELVHEGALRGMSTERIRRDLGEISDRPLVPSSDPTFRYQALQLDPSAEALLDRMDGTLGAEALLDGAHDLDDAARLIYALVVTGLLRAPAPPPLARRSAEPEVLGTDEIDVVDALAEIDAGLAAQHTGQAMARAIASGQHRPLEPLPPERVAGDEVPTEDTLDAAPWNDRTHLADDAVVAETDDVDEAITAPAREALGDADGDSAEPSSADAATAGDAERTAHRHATPDADTTGEANDDATTGDEDQAAHLHAEGAPTDHGDGAPDATTSDDDDALHATTGDEAPERAATGDEDRAAQRSAEGAPTDHGDGAPDATTSDDEAASHAATGDAEHSAPRHAEGPPTTRADGAHGSTGHDADRAAQRQAEGPATGHGVGAPDAAASAADGAAPRHDEGPATSHGVGAPDAAASAADGASHETTGDDEGATTTHADGAPDATTGDADRATQRHPENDPLPRPSTLPRRVTSDLPAPAPRIPTLSDELRQQVRARLEAQAARLATARPSSASDRFARKKGGRRGLSLDLEQERARVEAELRAAVDALEAEDLYGRLELTPDADTDAVEAAFERLSRRVHPDRVTAGLSSADVRLLAERRANLLRQAYETLAHSETRGRYRRQLGLERAPEDAPVVVADDLFARGREALSAGDWATARTAFAAAAKRSPDEGAYVAYLAWATFQAAPEDAEARDAALELLHQAEELNPWSEDVHVFAGRIHQRQGRAEAAVQSYQRALRCNPDCVEAIDAVRTLAPPPPKKTGLLSRFSARS